jgi:hypothetical protein
LEVDIDTVGLATTTTGTVLSTTTTGGRALFTLETGLFLETLFDFNNDLSGLGSLFLLGGLFL